MSARFIVNVTSYSTEKATVHVICNHVDCVSAYEKTDNTNSGTIRQGPVEMFRYGFNGSEIFFK